MQPSDLKQRLYDQLALDYCCTPAEAADRKNQFHVYVPLEGRRRFEEKPVVTFTDNTMVITSTKTQVQYDLSVIEKFTFDDIEDAVIGIKADAASASITLDEYTVSISGAKPDTQVRLLASDGRQLQSYKTAQDGSVTFSIADLPTGNYIIASESIIVKILKK